MGSHEETVADLERQVGEALVRRDVEALQHFFAGDFVGINPMGIEITKADVLAQIGSSDYEPESIVNDVRRVRRFGDITVVAPEARPRASTKDNVRTWSSSTRESGSSVPPTGRRSPPMPVGYQRAPDRRELVTRDPFSARHRPTGWTPRR